MHSYVVAVPHTVATVLRGGAGGLLLVLFAAAYAWGAPRELPEARVGKAYEYAVIYQGLVEPVKTEWQGLPPWLTANGPRLQGTPKQATVGPLELRVTLTDQLGKQLQGGFLLSVRPAIQPLVLAKPVIPPLPVGEPVSIWFTARGGEGRLRWEARWVDRLSGIEAEIDNDAGTCCLVGTPTTEGGFQLQVIVRDETGATDQHQFRGVAYVFASPLRIVTPQRASTAGRSPEPVVELPQATFCYPYTGNLKAEGGRPPYQWSVQWRVTPPPGLDFNIDEGSIKGSPTHLGEFPFTVTLRDAAGTQKQAGGNLTVVAPKCNLSLVQRALPAAVVGYPFEAILCVEGLTTDAEWIVSGLPPWLSSEPIGHVACKLSGMPSESGQWDIAVKVSATAPMQTLSGDSLQEIANTSRTFTLHVSPKEIRDLIFHEPHPPVAVQNRPYEYCFVTEGGEGPVSFTFAGKLPPSITTDSKGVIRADSMSEVGTFPFTVTATSADKKREHNCTLYTLPADTNVPLDMPEGLQLDARLFQKSVLPLPVHGGMPPYTATIEAAAGIQPLSCGANSSVAFRLHRPLRVETTLRICDSAGRSITRSVFILPVVPLGYTIPSALAMLLMVCGATVCVSKFRGVSPRRNSQHKAPSNVAAGPRAADKTNSSKRKQGPKRH